MNSEFPYRIGTRVRFQHKDEWLIGYVVGKQDGAYQDVLVPTFGRNGTVYQVHNCFMNPQQELYTMPHTRVIIQMSGGIPKRIVMDEKIFLDVVFTETQKSDSGDQKKVIKRGSFKGNSVYSHWKCLCVTSAEELDPVFETAAENKT
jgi:hypothetical protein